jgi:hypothetical protein
MVKNKASRWAYIMHKLPAIHWHLWENLRLPIRRNKSKNEQTVRQPQAPFIFDTYSANVFSTRATNFPFAPTFAYATKSSPNTTALPVLSLVSALMPKASANLAFLFAIAHSFVHLICFEDEDGLGVVVDREH